MSWIESILVGVLIVLGTMWLVKNICNMKFWKNWGIVKYVVCMAGVLFISFYLRHFLMCYAGIDAEIIWMGVFGVQVSFPRYLIVFGVVNLLLPGLMVLFFRTMEGDESFGQSSYGATSCIALAGFSWHLIYMYPEIDECIAFFSALTITIMILYSYRLAMKEEVILRPKKVIEIVSVLGCVVLFLAVATRYLLGAIGDFEVWYTFMRMDCRGIRAWSCILLTIIYMTIMWYAWSKCKKLSRKVFAFPAVLMPSLRWGYGLLMNFGMLPYIDEFVGIPFKDRYIVYDLMCVGILLMCVRWRERNKKMLLVKTPVNKVFMLIEEKLLMKLIEEKTCENESAKMRMKRFFWETAREVEGDVDAWLDFLSYMWENAELTGYSNPSDAIATRTKVDSESVYLISETDEELDEAKEWLAKFMNENELEFSRHIVPGLLFF